MTEAMHLIKVLSIGVDFLYLFVFFLSFFSSCYLDFLRDPDLDLVLDLGGLSDRDLRFLFFFFFSLWEAATVFSCGSLVSSFF